MTRISLAEYDPAAPRQQLHALLKVAEEVGADLSARLRALVPGIVLRAEPGSELLLVVFPEGGDRAACVRALGEVLDGYADAPAGTAPEVLETRLVAVTGGNGADPLFSRHFRLVSDPARLVPGEPALLVAHGTSFGSGRHPSTRLAMAALDRLAGAPAPFPARVLDVGCGSGILALACGVLGAREVLGIDIDTGALAVAAENGAANGLAERVRFSAQPLAELADPYDLLVANVTGAVMSGMLGEFARLVEPGGWLVISGLQGRQLSEISASLTGQGFAPVEQFSEDPWRAGLLRRAGAGPLWEL